MSQVEQIPAHDWENWLETNRGIVLDVRQPDEWKQGVLPGAQKIAMSEIQGRLHELSKETALLCVCRSGGRSQQVANYLNSLGFEASNLSGGMKALGLQD